MVIFQVSRDGKNYRATITSDAPIFAQCEDIWRLADEHGIDRTIVEDQMRHDEFPSPINHDNGIDGAPEEGIWMYDRVEKFIEWLSSNPAFNTRLVSKNEKKA